MAEAVLSISSLPANPLDAAADFHANYLPGIREDFRTMGELDLVIVFEPAGHEHRAWRLAAIQELAREVAPNRVNAIAGDDEKAIAETLGFLETAPGVTGQLLAVDGKFGETR